MKGFKKPVLSLEEKNHVGNAVSSPMTSIFWAVSEVEKKLRALGMSDTNREECQKLFAQCYRNIKKIKEYINSLDQKDNAYACEKCGRGVGDYELPTGECVCVHCYSGYADHVCEDLKDRGYKKVNIG